MTDSERLPVVEGEADAALVREKLATALALVGIVEVHPTEQYSLDYTTTDQLIRVLAERGLGLAALTRKAVPLDAWWRCGRGHVFDRQFSETNGDKEGQGGFDYWVPAYCFVEDIDGEPCGDSSHLFGPFTTAREALARPPVSEDPREDGTR